ncbi:MAG: MmgE/PrpD family protein [Pseudomonadota bacterium]
MIETSRLFVRHALGASYEDMPEEARRAAKTFFLDTLGVGVAGAKAPYADEIFSVVEQWGAPRGAAAPVLGRAVSLPPPSAAYVNGFQIHCQEYDCVHEPAVVHPMATIFAALTAEAARSGPVDGATFIAAMTAAVDIATGLGVAAKAPIKFFRPATAGVFGATLGCARLRGLSEAAALDALGYALSQAAGTMQAHVEGKPALPVQIAAAARAALVAVDLAAAGVPGANDAVDGPFGYLPLFEGDYELAPVLDSLGEVWRIAQVSHKPFPTGRAAQGGIVAVQCLKTDEGVTAGALDSLTLTAPPLIHRLVGRPVTEDLSVNYARLCFPYLAAVTLRNGTVGLGDFSPEALSDPETLGLARRVRVIDDGNPDPAAFAPATLEARLVDGAVKRVAIDRLYGSPADPMSREAHLQKFRGCIAFGAGSADAAEAAIVRVDALEDEPDVAALVGLFSAAS